MINQRQLCDYPDVLDVEQMREILGIGRNLAYQLLSSKQIIAKKIGHNWMIAKANLINLF